MVSTQLQGAMETYTVSLPKQPIISVPVTT